MVQARPRAERLEEVGEIGILGRPKNAGERGWPEVGTGMLLPREEGKTREGNKHDAAGDKKGQAARGSRASREPESSQN